MMKERAPCQLWIGQYDMMMPRCIVMNDVSPRIPATIHQIHHSDSWVPQIYIPDAITSHIPKIRLSSILQQSMSKKSTYIWGAHKKKVDDNISNRQLLLMQAMLLVGHGYCDQQNVSKEATSNILARCWLGQFGSVSGIEQLRNFSFVARTCEDEKYLEQKF